MKYRTRYRIYNFAGRIGSVLLFVIAACYVFTALGLFSLGIVAFPSVLLGRLGILTVTSDISGGALLMISGGVLLLGTGMCLGAVPVCASFYGIFRRFLKSSAVRRERAYNEEDQTS